MREIIFIINSDILVNGKMTIADNSPIFEFNKNDLYILNFLKSIENTKTFLISDNYGEYTVKFFDKLSSSDFKEALRLEFLTVDYEHRVSFVNNSKNFNNIIVYIGSSIFDIPAMKKSDLSCSINTEFLISDNVDFVSPFKNGLTDCIFYALYKYLNKNPMDLVNEYLEKKRQI